MKFSKEITLNASLIKLDYLSALDFLL